jgi:hypothetical protein
MYINTHLCTCIYIYGYLCACVRVCVCVCMRIVKRVNLCAYAGEQVISEWVVVKEIESGKLKGQAGGFAVSAVPCVCKCACVCKRVHAEHDNVCIVFVCMLHIHACFVYEREGTRAHEHDVVQKIACA